MMKSPNFKVVKSEKHEFYTKYIIWYKKNDKEYICNHNGSLPNLNGSSVDNNCYLSERLRCELADLLEEHFLNSLS